MIQKSAWHSVSTKPGRRQHTDLVVQQPTGEAPEEAHVVPAGAAGAFPYSLCRLRDWRDWRNWRHGHRGIECRCQRAKLISLRFVGRKKISYQARVFWRSVIAEQARRGRKGGMRRLTLSSLHETRSLSPETHCTMQPDCKSWRICRFPPICEIGVLLAWCAL